MVQTRRAAAAAAPKRRKNKLIASREKLALDLDHPSPKRPRRTSPNKSAANKVTPSPKSNTNKKSSNRSSPWLKYDELLSGTPRSFSPYDRVLTPDEHRWDHMYMFLEYTLNPQDKKFKKVMEELLRKDSLFQNEFGIDHSRPFHNVQNWSRWAVQLSTYPKKRIKAVLQEYQKDMKLHSNLLKELTPEINERKLGGKRYYLRALNCIFLDSFARCHVPLPPLPLWDLNVKFDITRKELYKSQLRAWEGHKSRCFAIVRAVIATPRKREDYTLPDIVPLEFRGEMVSMKEDCTNEEHVIEFSTVDDDTEDGHEEKKEEVDEEEKDLNTPQCSCHKCRTYFRLLGWL